LPLRSKQIEKIEGQIGEGREKAEENALPHPKIIKIACGSDHTVALAEDGNVFTWGYVHA
jgi:alpha-tubulin suppressor-like RCC1 family protein